MPNLVLVRHGESHGNVDPKHWLDDSTNFLTIAGTAEALGCGYRLRDHIKHFDVVFSSQYTRAKHTARVLMETMKYDGPYLVDPRFNEIRYDQTTGEKNETYEQLSARVMSAHVEQIVPFIEKNANILVISHYHTLRQYIHGLTGSALYGPDKLRPHHVTPYIIPIVDGKLTNSFLPTNLPS